MEQKKWLPFVTSHLGYPEKSKVSLYWDDVFPGCSPGPDQPDQFETNNQTMILRTATMRSPYT